MHLKPRLLTKEGKRTEPGSKNAEEERNRRDEERRLFKELSRYYPLGDGKEVWTRPKLLLRGKHGDRPMFQRRPTYPNLSQCWKTWRVSLSLRGHLMSCPLKLRRRQRMYKYLEYTQTCYSFYSSSRAKSNSYFSWFSVFEPLAPMRCTCTLRVDREVESVRAREIDMVIQHFRVRAIRSK